MICKFYLNEKEDPLRQPCLTQCCLVSRLVGGTAAVTFHHEKGGRTRARELETRNLKTLLYCLNSSNEHALLSQFKKMEQKILYLGLRFKKIYISDKYIWKMGSNMNTLKFYVNVIVFPLK